jgi:catechol 2,3-dioxygenase-like lactoylglutathione lyase family enzyme
MLANSHIVAVIPVTDLARARKFYEGVLGLSVSTNNVDQGVVIYESAGTHLMIYQRPTASSGEHTIAGFDVAGDFDAVVDGLIARGVKFDTFEIPGAELPWDDRGVLNDGIRASVWFKDPDGNVLNVGKGGL